MANKNRGISKTKNHKHKIVGDKSLTGIAKLLGVILLITWGFYGLIYMIMGTVRAESGYSDARICMFVLCGLTIITWLLSRLYPEVK